MAPLIDTQTITIIAEHYSRSAKRLLLFDYDGTLVPFAKNPADAVPDPAVIRLLKSVSSDERNTTAIISGRTRRFLESHLTLPRLTLIAEHGAFARLPNEAWSSPFPIDTSWKNDIVEHLRSYTCPESFIEIKESAVVWHYRECDEAIAARIARRIMSNAGRLFRNRSKPGILDGNKAVEFKPPEVTKGAAVRRIFPISHYDFIFAIGDDTNDEPMFRSLPAYAYTFRIGHTESSAQFLIHELAGAMPILEKIFSGLNK